MSEPFSAVVAGHLCLDIIPDLSCIPAGSFISKLQPGRMMEVGPAVFSTGGPVSNTGLALHRLGIPVRLVGKVGPDPLGRIVCDLIERHGAGLSSGMIIDPSMATSYTIILNPPGYDRFFIHDTAANRSFCADDVDLDLVGQARLFHFGYPPLLRRMYLDCGRELVTLFSRVHALGVTTSLDMTYPDPASESGRTDWRVLLAAVLPYVNVFLPSVEEILYMLDRPLHDRLKARGGLIDQTDVNLLHDLSDQLLEMGAQVVGLKIGERGLYLRTAAHGLADMGRAAPADPASWAGQEMWVPCFQVEVAGTTGSGDATIAGFLAGLLRGLSLRQSVTAAVAVGACNVEAVDALGGLRPWEETLARVAAGWPRRSLPLDAPGWSWDAKYGLWFKQ